MGAPRIVPTRGIPFPTGDPSLEPMRLEPKLTPELQARVPAAVLRMPQPERRHAAYAETVADLHELAVALAGRDK